MTREDRTPDDGRTAFTLYYEDEHGALLFDESAGPYALYSDRSGRVAVVETGTELAGVRDVVRADRAQSAAAPVRGTRISRRDLRRSARRRGAAAAVASICTAAMVLAPGVGGSASGSERPSKILQAVEIELAADGSIEKIRSTDIRRTEGKAKHNKDTFNPAKVADQLPVRVLTSYVHDGRTGTNLADLKDAKGRVEITITVQNTTLEPARIEYNDNGAGREAYGLIADPLTITASAVLPKNSISTVVLPEPNARGAVTNGVVGENASGDTTVQWGAMLAPPRLAPTASFTLVTDATGFRMPKFDLSVQPGLVTDTSIERLVRDAFGDGPRSPKTLENRTITAVDDVKKILDKADKTLGGVSDGLSDAGQQLSGHVLGRLTDSSSMLTVEAVRLSAELDQLDVELSASVDASRNENDAALRDIVRKLRDYMGEPDDRPVAPLPVAPGCKVAFGDAKQADTLFAQLKRVTQQLRTLQSATDECAASVTDAIAADLGDPDDCPVTAKSIACALAKNRNRLGSVAEHLKTEGQAIVDKFAPSAVVAVRTELTALTKAVGEVRQAAAKLGPRSPNQADHVEGELTALSTTLGTLAASVRPGGNGLASAIDALHDTAVQRADEVGGTNGDAASISRQVAAAADAVCDTPAGVTPSDDLTTYLNDLRALLVGQSCGNGANAVALPLPPGYPAPVSARLVAQHQAWSTLAEVTDVSAPAASGPAKELDDLADALAAAKAAVDSVRADVGGDGASLSNKIRTLQEKIAALHDDTPKALCPAAPTPDVLPSLNALERAFAVVECNQEGLASRLEKLVGTAVPTYSDVAGEVGEAAHKANAARLAAATAVDDLLGTLETSLGSAADRAHTEGAGMIRLQQGRIANQEADFVASLDSATKKALDRITASVAESNRLVEGSTTSLERALAEVRASVGDPSRPGGGLLGIVGNNAADAKIARDTVARASGNADTFTDGRRLQIAETDILEKQFELAMERTQQPFGMPLPRNATCTVVYSFHLQGV